MKISQLWIPWLRIGGLAVVVVVSVLLFAQLWTSGGGKIPFVSAEPYRMSLEAPDVNNLVVGSNVAIAGVPVGRVTEIDALGDKARVAMEIQPDHAPMHEGLIAQFREKTLVGETYIDLIDGKGAELSEGTLLPAADVRSLVKLDDVLRTLDEPTKQALSGALRSLGDGTENTSASVSAALRGAGDLSREGRTALSALGDQTKDLAQLSGNTARVLGALDARQGQIAQLVTDANRLTQVTAGSSTQIEQVMRIMPGFLGTTREASGSLSGLSAALGPAAANLREAGDPLNKALELLPGTAADLRGLLPSLSQTLDKGPATLDRVPAVSADLRDLLPNADRALRNLNPMLDYVEPYGRDIATFFTNFGLTIARGDANGSMLRVMPLLNEQSLKDYPVGTNGIRDRNQAFPPPMGQESEPDRSPLYEGR